MVKRTAKLIEPLRRILPRGLRSMAEEQSDLVEIAARGREKWGLGFLARSGALNSGLIGETWLQEGLTCTSHATGMRGGSHVRSGKKNMRERSPTCGVTREKKRVPLRSGWAAGRKRRWARERRKGPEARGLSHCIFINK